MEMQEVSFRVYLSIMGVHGDDPLKDDYFSGNPIYMQAPPARDQLILYPMNYPDKKGEEPNRFRVIQVVQYPSYKPDGITMCVVRVEKMP